MNADPLEALRPLHLPEAVGWWPPAPLWWLVALITLLLAFTSAYALLRHIRRNRYRRLARREIAAALTAVRAGECSDGFAIRASTILRRAALCRYPKTDVAPLHGRAWLAFLDRSGRMNGFSSGPGEALGLAAYAERPDCDPEALADLCQRWLRRHR
jgi:hypothetical protein